MGISILDRLCLESIWLKSVVQFSMMPTGRWQSIHLESSKCAFLSWEK